MRAQRNRLSQPAAPHAGQLSKLLLALIVSAATGCSAPDPAPGGRPAAEPGTAAPGSAADAPTVLLRGRAVFGHETRSFIPCGEDEALWVSEGVDLLGEPGTQFDLFAIVDARRLPAPAEGFGADHAGGLAIEFVHYAGYPEGPRCDFEWNSFRYRARGNEPFWMLEVTDPIPEDGPVSDPGEPTPVRLELITPEERVALGVALLESTTEGWQVRVREASTPIDLTVRREPCRDSMSGNYFGYSAAFRYQGGTFTGCVLIGTG
jgi:putative lipoprotein